MYTSNQQIALDWSRAKTKEEKDKIRKECKNFLDKTYEPTIVLTPKEFYIRFREDGTCFTTTRDDFQANVHSYYVSLMKPVIYLECCKYSETWREIVNERVRWLKRVENHPELSLDYEYGDGFTIEELLGEEDEFIVGTDEKSEDDEILKKIKSSLSKSSLKRQYVVQERTNGKTFRQIGEDLGITKQAVQILWKTEINRLRRIYNGKKKSL